MICCGKERNTPYCPNCGKAMTKEAGLLGLKGYVDGKLKEYEAKVQQKKREVEIRSTNTYYSLSTDSLKNQLEKLQKQEAKWRDWQEALIKAIDGE